MIHKKLFLSKSSTHPKQFNLFCFPYHTSKLFSDINQSIKADYLYLHRKYTRWCLKQAIINAHSRWNKLMRNYYVIQIIECDGRQTRRRPLSVLCMSYFVAVFCIPLRFISSANGLIDKRQLYLKRPDSMLDGFKSQEKYSRVAAMLSQSHTPGIRGYYTLSSQITLQRLWIIKQLQALIQRVETSA